MEGSNSRESASRLAIAVITVTYGKRWHLLSQVLQAVAKEPRVQAIVVVDNGASPSVSVCLGEPSRATQAPFVHVVPLTRNRGSAPGFAAGIEFAAQLQDITHLLLLDDDNVPDSGWLDGLLAANQIAGVSQPAAVVALRRGRKEYEELIGGSRLRQITRNSFLGFHLAELPSKVLKRFGRKSKPGTPTHVRPIDVAPYGGLFVPIDSVRSVEPPRSELVLYGDDHDYTLRLTQAGAQLLLTDLAIVQDLDASWNSTDAVNSANPWIAPGSPSWRAYYSLRNRVLLERAFTDSLLVYRLNQLLYLSFLAASALRAHSSIASAARSLRPLMDGLRDAHRNQLGERDEYKLPQTGGESVLEA